MNFKEQYINGHSVAPYNFVSLPRTSIAPYENIDSLPKHNKLDKNFLSGSVEFEIVAKTPIIVAKNSDDNNKTFFKNLDDKNTIPGNTIRGLVRTNLAVLSRSNVSDDIEDSRFFFRSFGKDITADEYKKRLDIRQIKEDGNSYSIARTVEAGFIYMRGKDDYVIVPSKKIQGEQYFRIGEQFLRRAIIDFKVNYMYNDRIKELITNLAFKGPKNKREKNMFLKRIQERAYKPYCKNISFDVKDKRTISKVGRIGTFRFNGHIISSSYIQGKLGHYVIAEGDFNSGNILELNGDMLKHIEFYNDDYERTKKKDEFFKLPTKIGKENGKPIFYGRFDNNIYMGFTPYFRIPYDKNLKAGIRPSYKDAKGFSFMDALFGFSNKGENNLSYKSRLSFTDFVYTKDTKVNSKLQSQKYYDVVLGGPKASCFQNYLVQDHTASPKDLKTYNSNEFDLRGIKHYWQKNYIDAKATGNERMDVRLNPLKIGSTFKGKIHFNNLSKEELGLLLWSIKVADSATENIGLGKPYGFGRVEFKDINLEIENLEEKYNSMSFDFSKKEDKEVYINLYKEYLKREHKVDAKTDKQIQELILLKTTVLEEENYNEGRYMSLGKEFSEKLPLLNVTNQVKILKGERLTGTSFNRQNTESKASKNSQFKNSSSKNKGATNKSNTNKRGQTAYKDIDHNCDNGFGALADFFK